MTDKRSEERSNVFLAATLTSGAGQAPVRIRNISSRGALVQGNGLPPEGSKVRLVRGQLSAAGEIAWVGEGHAGLTFNSDIAVADWVRRAGHAGQQRVDQIVAALRSSDRMPGGIHSKEDTPSLTAISAALDAVCERLASQPGIGVEFGEELIRLDTIAETLRRLSGRKS